MSGPAGSETAQETATAHGSDHGFDRVVMRKVTLRLIPFLFVLYIVNILDRANVGFAKLQMQPALDLSDGAFGLGMGIFYIGYILFEVPSNLILNRIGARLWIARIMITWGIISSCMLLVRGLWSFYLLRILLGVAEAGFFPGIILYLTYWYPARERARMVACFMAASPMAGVVGYPLSGALMQYLDQLAGLAGWQWLFLLEGIPAVLLGFAVWFLLTDRPEHARWLTPSERTRLVERMSREQHPQQERHLLPAMMNPKVWLLCALYFTVALASNGFGFYLPTFVKGHFGDRSEFELGLLSAVPPVAAIIGMVLIGIHSDRSGERRLHVAGSALLAAVGLCLSAYLKSPWLALLALALTQVGIMSMLPPFWSLPTAFLGGVAAAGGIALINSVGNSGGFVGPYLVGYLKDVTGAFTAALLVMATTMAIGVVLALYVRHDPSLEKAPPEVLS